MTAGVERGRARRIDLGELALAAGAVLFGALVVWQTGQIRLTPAYSRVGPRVIPYVVGGGLVLIGFWLVAEVVSGRSAAPSAESEDADPTLPTDWRTIGLLTVALAGYFLGLERVGFVLASAFLYAMAAFAMGSRRSVRDVVVGVLLAGVLFVGFTRGLGLGLPGGVLGGVL